MSRHAAADAARAAAPAVLAVAAFLLFLLAPPGGYALACLTILASAALHRPPPLGTDPAARAVLAAGVLQQAAAADYPAPVLLVTGALLLGLPLVEPVVTRLARPWYHAAHLPAPPGVPAAFVGNGVAWGVAAAAVLLSGLAAVTTGPAWALLAPAVAAAGFIGWLAVDGVRRLRESHRGELARLTRALERHRPTFLLYFSAPPGSAYQIRMWLPHLAQLGEPFLVVTPERHNLAAVAAATSAPVVAYESFEALDAVMVPSLRAAFYVNNGMHNAHCVRYTRLTHVQLYHGDSDKAVTASPINQLYDRVFVAGQAAIDRFAAHGVTIPAERFRIIGRPQVAALATAERPVRQARPPVVLYAPTWSGAHADSDYCSLPIAEKIIEALLARGAVVIFRPHPYATRDRAGAAHVRWVERRLAADRASSGREHRFGPEATERMSLFACMDRSDAMICDVSSVASDYLFTGKPFAITDMRGEGEAFTDHFPVARAAYVVAADAGNLPAVLDDLLDADPLQPRRQQLRTYYLGDIPADRYPEAFLTEARRCLTDQARPARIH